jgi:ABC-2 type transport system permease protein
MSSSRRLIFTIARKEFIEILRDRRFLTAAVLLLGSVVLSSATQVRQHASWQREATIKRQAERDRWLHQGAKSPHSAAHFGVHAFLPRTQLSILDPGVTAYAGTFVFLEPHEQKLFEHRPAEDSPAIRRFGEFTPAFLLQVIAPLLIILMLYGAFASEREQGTLRQLLSLGVSSRAIALGKTIGGTAPLFGVLTPGVLVGSAAILATGEQNTGDITIRLALLSAAFLGYYATVSGIVLWSSATARTSRGALTLSLGFWFLTCLVAPRAVMEIAARAHPAPTALQHINALRAEWFQRPVWYDLLADVEKRLLKQYGVNDVAALPISAAGAGLMEEEAGQKEANDRHFGRLYRAYGRQEDFFRAAARVSPMVAVNSISAALSGSDYSHFKAFATAAEAYRTSMVRTLNEAVMNNQSASAKPYEPAYRPGRELWESIPAFTYAAPSVSELLPQLAPSLTWLAAWIGVALALAGWGLSRLRPE